MLHYSQFSFLLRRKLNQPAAGTGERDPALAPGFFASWRRPENVGAEGVPGDAGDFFDGDTAGGGRFPATDPGTDGDVADAEGFREPTSVAGGGDSSLNREGLGTHARNRNR